MAELPSNPVPFEVLEETDEPFRTGLELTVYSYEDPFTPLDVIPERTQLKCLDEIGGPGGGSFRIFRNDPKLTETPNLIEYENIFKVSLDGRVVGAFIKGAETTDFLNQNERSGEYIESSGEGLRAWFHGATVQPYGGLRSDSADARVFSFASEQGSWYIPADWVTPTVIQDYNMDPNPGPFGTAPADWPDAPAAKWIWGEANNGTTDPATEGLNYFRYEFDVSGLTGADNFSVFVSAKDQFQVFMDGQQIIEAKEDDAYSKTWRADFQLTNGHHILAVKVLSKGTGASAMIAALFKAGDATAGTEAELLTVSNTTGWKVNAYPDPAPGWSPGEIMLTLLEEAEARGIRFPTYLSPTFTATHDSDGAEWPRQLDWSFDIGTEYIDVIEKLEELVCDVWINPANYELNMYAERGTHLDVQTEAVEPVKFEIAKNVTRAQAEGTSEIKNTLIMRTEDGWQTVADGLSDSIEKYGRREGFVATGASQAVSGDLAQRIFEKKGKPSVSATYDVIDVDGARPFLDFGAGDWVLAPSERDETILETRRTMSLSVSENDENGLPEFAIEFDTIAQDLARRFDRWLKTTSDGTLGGSLSNVSGGGGGGGGTPIGQNVRTGPTGQQGLRGLPGFNNRGVWELAEVYDISDTVSWAGQWWVANKETNDEPTLLSADWDLLEVAPSTTPAIGATLYLTANYSAPAAATAIPWTGERYKSNITHAVNDTTLVIQDPGPYLIAGKFAMSSNAIRNYDVQVNAVTIFSTNSYSVNFASTRAVADLDAYLVYLNVGDVVRVMSTGAATHSILATTDTWLSIVKVTGARGETGATGQGLTWRDEWTVGLNYAAYDLVEAAGSTYICTAPHTATNATQPGIGASWTTRWALVASKGNDGDPGDPGDPGEPGAGLVIIGTLADESELPGTGSPGDAYLIDSDLYIWSTLLSDWENVGPLTGGGGGGGSGGGYAASNFVKTTGVISPLDREVGMWAMNSAEVQQVLMVTSDRRMRLRFYASVAQRDADLATNRAPSQDPIGNHGVLMDVVLDDGILTQVVSPVPTIFNTAGFPGEFPYVIDNLDPTYTGFLTVTVLAKGLPGAALGGHDVADYLKTTGSLANGAAEQGTFTLSSAEVHQGLVMSADKACRVRFYASTAQRTADLSRPISQDPTGDHGLLLEVVFPPGSLSRVLGPAVTLFASSGFGPVPVTITNMSGSTGAVTVTLTAKGV